MDGWMVAGRTYMDGVLVDVSVDGWGHTNWSFFFLLLLLLSRFDTILGGGRKFRYSVYCLFFVFDRQPAVPFPRIWYIFSPLGSFGCRTGIVKKKPGRECDARRRKRGQDLLGCRPRRTVVGSSLLTVSCFVEDCFSRA